MVTQSQVSLAQMKLRTAIAQARNILDEGGTPSELLWTEIEEHVDEMADLCWQAQIELNNARKSPPSAA